MSKRGALRNFINTVLMKIFMILLWGASIACIIADTGLWIPMIMMCMSIIFISKSIYDDVVQIRIELDMYNEENGR